MKTIILTSFAYAEFEIGGFKDFVSVVVTTDNCKDMHKLCFLSESGKIDVAKKLEDAIVAFAKIHVGAPNVFYLDNSISEMIGEYMQGRHMLEEIERNTWRFTH